jgi:hypothetical protein
MAVVRDLKRRLGELGVDVSSRVRERSYRDT